MSSLSLKETAVLEFDRVSKLYSLGKIGTGTLSRDLTRWWHTSVLHKEDPYLRIGETNKHSEKGNSDFVWALHDINFTVNQGDVVGIIGKNGSGKSTLLKIVSGITAPTQGLIRIKGRIASLLEVGTGFHPDLTGRENIYMNGAILGMTKQEISRKLDEIVDFSGIERYIDTPIKRYSSGMNVRLGFAVAAFLEPEILLVDEVLAVGDAEFQKRAIGKMKSVSSEDGRTVLFVSHNMNSVLQLCNRGIILNEGQLIYNGDVFDAVHKYVDAMGEQSFFEGIDGDINNIYITKASIRAGNSLEKSFFLNSSNLKIQLEVVVKNKIPNLVIGLNLLSQFGSPIIWADYNAINNITTLDPGKYIFNFEIPSDTLMKGNYTVQFNLSQKGVRNFSNKTSNLHFKIRNDHKIGGPIYNSQNPIVTSLIKGKWIKNYKCIEKYK